MGRATPSAREAACNPTVKKVEEVIKVNRKLIRTTLAEIKGKERSVPQPQRGERTNGAPSRSSGDSAPSSPPPRAPQQSSSAGSSSVQVRKRTPPPLETNAELFYYKKQIDAHTPMVIVLQDGEEIEGTIEWYDRGALKVNRREAPNLLVLKHNIKYMFKQEEREGQKETKESKK
jgi:sRNA-binding regulator protein Hfq